MTIKFPASIEIDYICFYIDPERVSAKGRFKMDKFEVNLSEQHINFAPSKQLMELLKKEVEENLISNK